MFTIHKISFFLPRRSFQSVFIKWKNKWQTEGSVEKNLLHYGSQMFVQQLCVLQNRDYFYSLLVSNCTTKGARHIFSPNKLWELGSCIPWTSNVMLYLKKKKAKQNKDLYFSYYFAIVIFDWTWNEWVYMVKGLFVKELYDSAWASCPYKQLTSQDAGSLLCLMKADFH